MHVCTHGGPCPGVFECPISGVLCVFAYVAAARTFWCRKRPNTLKTRTYYPKTFTTLGEANAWVSPWVPVYNATPHSGINYYPPQAVLDGTWTKLQRKREEGMRNALSEVTITQLPDTKAGTGLPAEVSIIRTTTQTAPTPQPITI